MSTGEACERDRSGKEDRARTEARTRTSIRRVLRAGVALAIAVFAAAQPAIGDVSLDADGEEAAWAAVLALANGASPPGDVAATPLGREAAPAVLLWRTLALYAVRAAAPEVESPALRDRVTRNLAALAGAVERPDSLRSGDTQHFGTVGLTAWVAWLHLLYRSYWDLDADAGEVGARGLALVEGLLAGGRAADGVAFAAERGAGACSPLATALAVLALSQAYENEELVRYEDDAFAASAACPGDGRDPAVRAYRAVALLELVKNSGSASLRDEARRLLAGAEAAPAALAFARRMLAHLDGEAAAGPSAPLGFRPLRRARRPPAAVAPAALRDPELRALFDSVFATLTERVPRRAGDFAWDYGDSPGYAVRVLRALGRADAAREVIEREQRLVARPWPSRFPELSFGADALAAAIDDGDPHVAEPAEAALRRLLLLSAGVAAADRWYPDRLDAWTGGGGYDYGATTLAAQIAIPHLVFAALRPGARVGWLVDPTRVGERIVAQTDRLAWDAAARRYRAQPQREGASLLASSMMMVALLQLHQLDSRPHALARVEAVAAGLDALWDPVRGAFFASEAARAEGGYQSLSSNSYALLAHWRLFRATGAPFHRERALAIARFLARDLYGHGVVAHHVYRHRRACGDLWCAGCNWRVLAILLELAEDETGSGGR